MNKKTRPLVVAGLLLLSPGLAIAATPVQFSSNPGSQAMAIADQIYGSYIAAMPSAGKVEVAMVDLDHNGMASVAVRFDDSHACDSSGACHTTILAYENKQWHEVFSSKVTDLAIADGPENQPAKVISNGHVVWQPIGAPDGSGIIYYPNIATYTGTTAVVPDQPANTMEITAADAALFPKGPPSYLKPSDYTAVALNVGGLPGTLYAIMDNFFADCGDLGCPMTIVDQNGVAVLSLNDTHGLMALANTSTNGVKDLVISDFQGLSTYQWDADSLVYKLAATSYSSKVTPIP